MPFTVNGIGTHYYGAGNRSARVDTCSQCHRSATLTSYDTREWFCFVYIPLIPLGRYRILDDCSSCRKHLRVPFAEFTQRVAAQLEPLRDAVARAPRDPQPRLDLIDALVSWELRGDAQKEAEDALAIFPGDAAIHVAAAQLATARSDSKAALPLYERAQTLDSQNGAAVYGYGWLLHQLGRDEEAIPVLQRTAAQSYSQPGALYLLGVSFMRLSRWSEALQAHQQLLALCPQYASDKKFMRLIADCKRRLGYELTEVERKAGRSWWPFGKNKPPKQPKLQAGGPNAIRPSLRIAGIAILVLMLLGGGYAAWDRYSNVNVYFDNGFARTMTVEVDGARDTVRSGAYTKMPLARGAHTVVVREAEGKELERMTFVVQPVSLFDAIVTDRFYVYNIGGMHVYRRAKHGYAVDVKNSTYEEQILGPERFFEQRDVDFVFSKAPNTISMDGSFTTKVAFNPATDIPLARYAMLRMVEGKMDEAKKVMAHAVANARCDVGTRHAELYLTSLVESAEAAAVRAQQWIGECAGDNIEAHRSYQDLNTGLGRQSAIRDEYRAAVAAAPDSAQAHYLYGRIAGDPRVELAEQTTAIRLDPKLVWPHVARGHLLAEEEKYDEALREYEEALDLPGRDSAIALYYATAAIAKGTPEVAVAKVDQLNAEEPVVLHARWMLAASARDWERASALQQKLAGFEGPVDGWWRKLRLLRIQGDEAVIGKELESAAAEKDLNLAVQRARVELALGRGDYQAAARALAAAKGLDAFSLAIEHAYAAGGLLITGSAADAARLLDQADAVLAADKAGEHRLAKALIAGVRGTMPVAEVTAIMRENNAMQHAWFVAGVRAAVAKDRIRAAQCLGRAVRASSDLDFPYFEVKRMASLF